VDAVADPGEGVAADGTIRTGARQGRVPAAFEPVLADVVALLGGSGASLYVYGSVATGTARPRSSDVDLLSIGLPGAAVLGQRVHSRVSA
jgi:Nucleotidyltransferase domain